MKKTICDKCNCEIEITNPFVIVKVERNIRISWGNMMERADLCEKCQQEIYDLIFNQGLTHKTN